MLRESFTEKKTGTLQKLTGEYQSRYGLIHYETYSFTPDPLGDEYPELSQKAVGAITRASMALARLSELGDGIPNPDLLRRPTMRREAQSTSALEGTYERIETVLAQDYEPGGDKTGWNESLVEVFNYLDAADHGIRSVREGRPIGIGLARELQRLLVADTKSDGPQARRDPQQPGVHRIAHPQDRGRTLRAHASRTGPRHRGAGADGLVEQPQRARARGARHGHVHSSSRPCTHSRTATDASAGSSSLLQMMSRGLLSQPLLSVSPWFEQRRPDYQDRLLEVSTRGDWEGWLLFFCQGIEESCEDALLRVKRLNNLRDRYRRLVADHRYGATTMNAAMTFIGQPYTTAPILSRAVGKSYTATRGALANLESLGIVKAVKGGNSIGYMAEDVMLAVSASAGHAVAPDAPLLSEAGGD